MSQWTNTPLFVDLDGTLLRSDSLHESLCLLCKEQPMALPLIFIWVLKGKAYFKARVAERVSPDVAAWPYRLELLDYLQHEKALGRRIVLATAANRAIAQSVADHLGFFDGVIASDETNNLSGGRKLEAIRNSVEGAPFSYAGNDRNDLAVWRGANGAVIVDASASVTAQARQLTAVEKVLARPKTPLKTYLKAIRTHQWLKNLLVFVAMIPILNHITLPQCLLIGWAFLAFSFASSSVYVLNDLMDLESDRRHPRKSKRPFACGSISIKTGLLLAVLLLASSLTLSVGMINLEFLVILLMYLTVTTAYSLRLKRMPIVDVIVLGCLYTMRIVGGAMALSAPPTFWLLAFSLFLFLSLALAKRCAELQVMMDAGQLTAVGRGYHIEDLSVLQSLGIGSGLVSVTVLGFYITAPLTLERFADPNILGLLCVVLLYWICRVWIKVHRGQMHDDPVVFALRDHISKHLVWVSAAIIAAAVWL
jgi:4-hydroxybenzoate polyprenyltransferase